MALSYFGADQYDKSCRARLFPLLFFTTQLHMHNNERGEPTKGFRTCVCACMNGSKSGCRFKRISLVWSSHALWCVSRRKKSVFLLRKPRVDHFAQPTRKVDTFFLLFAQCESQRQRSEKPDYWPQLSKRRGFPRVFRPAPFATFWALKLPFVCHYAFVTP